MKLLTIVLLSCIVQVLYCHKDYAEILKEVEDEIKDQLDEINDFADQDEESKSKTLADIAKELDKTYSINLDEFLEDEDAPKKEQIKQDPGFRIRKERRSPRELMELIRYLLALLHQRVDGGFSAWSHFGKCSKTCGGGYQTSTRTCTNPAPQNGGKNCQGKYRRTRKCSTNLCPTPLYRYWNPKISDHFYTRNYNELKRGNHGWNYEGIQCRLLPNSQSGAIPLYRYWLHGRDHFYTTNINEIGTSTPGQVGKHGYKSEGITGWCFAKKVKSTVPLYRYYNNRHSDHFYTTNANEIGTTTPGHTGKHGYKSEGVACYVYP